MKQRSPGPVAAGVERGCLGLGSWGLGGQGAWVLGVAAVVGHEADLAVLAHVVDLGYDDLLAALDAAVRARLLDERPGVPGRYAFHHAIVHNLLYAGLPAGVRGLLHQQVSQAMEALGRASRLREVADHLALGSAPGMPPGRSTPAGTARSPERLARAAPGAGGPAAF